MALVDPSTLTIGQTIRFKSISVHDNVLWSGTIEAICRYSAITLTEDVVPYYKEVVKLHPELPVLEKLTFLQLSLLENYESKRKRFFAREWIDPSSLEVVDVATSFDIRIYDTPSEQLATILELLRSHGYTAQSV